MNKPVCSDPNVVLNPHVIDFIFKHRLYYMNGHSHYYRGRKSYRCHDLLKFSLSPRRNGITNKTDLSKYYALSEDGEVCDIYMLVPCGKCDNCIMSKRYSFVQRCHLETMDYNSLPWFVTLTYRNSCLRYSSGYVRECAKPGLVYDDDSCCLRDPSKPGSPVADESDLGSTRLKFFPTLSVRDVQLFLKRLRINLERMYDGKYNFPIRYACCGEYGKKHRPHYHLIIWGINTFLGTDYLNVASIIDRSWNKGWITHRLVNTENDKCFKYTTKYMCKSGMSANLLHSCQRSPFLNTSKRNGGIGKHHLLSYQDYMLKTFDTNLKYFDRFTCKPKVLNFNSWSINILYPSFHRLVPSYVRRAVLELSFYHKYYGLDPFSYEDVFRPYMFIPDWDEGYLTEPRYSYSDAVVVFYRWRSKLQLYGDDALADYLSLAHDRDVSRQRFFYLLSFGRQDPDLYARAYKARLDINRSLALESL